jgi:predicted nucleic acid-binding protein
MNKVCFDTQVLVWALRRPRDTREEILNEKARYLLEILERSHSIIALPAVVVAEFLFAVPIGERPSALAALDHQFQIVPFDGLAAFEFTRLPRDGSSREKNKSDRMIIASAMAANASTLYSEDDDVHRIGNGHIDVQRLPFVPPQQLVLPSPELKPANFKPRKRK